MTDKQLKFFPTNIFIRFDNKMVMKKVSNFTYAQTTTKDKNVQDQLVFHLLLFEQRNGVQMQVLRTSNL